MCFSHGAGRGAMVRFFRVPVVPKIPVRDLDVTYHTVLTLRRVPGDCDLPVCAVSLRSS
jgi:hypothetical protein